ncbi:MAG: hypothetical protein VKL98_02330 [Cyanobacteriota bacterium]|nr:hypothetical protein [Cyanobacteriota bacterium]
MLESLPPYLPWMLFGLHCAVGLVAAQIAGDKGYRRQPWLLWGLVGGTVALIDSLRRPHRPQ